MTVRTIDEHEVRNATDAAPSTWQSAIRRRVQAAREIGALGIDLYQARRRRAWTREQVERHQAAVLRDLRAHVYQRSPFYQRFHQGLMDRPLSELPVLTKPIMMEHYDDLVTDRSIRRPEVQEHLRRHDEDVTLCEPRLGGYYVDATSGSSGYRGLFLQDETELRRLFVSFIRAQRMTGAGINWYRRPRVAMVATTNPLGIVEHVISYGRKFHRQALHINTFDPVDTIIDRLNAFQPSALIIFGRMAVVLTEAQRSGALRIAPRVVLSSAEILTDSARRSIAETWGAKVVNIYAATETGLLASECPHGRGMHLLDDWVIVENVDERNQPVPPGEYGHKLLVTVLFRRTQPLIRYELTDMLRISPEPCPCGRAYPLIDDIQGRTWETLYFATPDGREVPVHPLHLHRVLKPFPAEWQLIQEPSGLRVLFSHLRGPVDDGEVTAKLERALLDQGVSVVPIVIERVPELPKTPGGKTAVIRSLIPRAQPAS